MQLMLRSILKSYYDVCFLVERSMLYFIPPPRGHDSGSFYSGSLNNAMVKTQYFNINQSVVRT